LLVPEEFRRILLDQNIPQAILKWLKEKLPDWEIRHVNELGFQGKTDEFLYLWAQENGAIIVTYDEDLQTPGFTRLEITMGLYGFAYGPLPLKKPETPLNVL